MYQRHTILANCTAASGFQGMNVTNINAPRLFELLDSCVTGRGDFARDCKDLLTEMNSSNWQITAGIHAGGLGDMVRGADPRNHITVRVGHRSYHLRFSGSGTGLRLMQIT